MSFDGSIGTQLSTGTQPQFVPNVATSLVRLSPPNHTLHFSRPFDVQANSTNRPDGPCPPLVNRILASLRPSMPRGTTVTVRATSKVCESSFADSFCSSPRVRGFTYY